MKKRFLLWMTAAVVGSATLYASGFGGHPKCGGEQQCERKSHGGMEKMEMVTMLKQLDLTESQKEQLRALRKSGKAAKEERVKMREETRPQRPSLARYMTETTFDVESFKKEMRQKMAERRGMMEKREAQMVEKKVAHMQKLFNILTPEQRKKLIQLSEEKQEL